MNTKSVGRGLCALGMLAAGTTWAAAPDGDVAMWPYLGASFDYILASGHRHSDDGLGGYFGGGVPINRWLNLELGGFGEYFSPDKSAPTVVGWRDYGLKLDGQYFFSRNPAFAPYAVIGLGNAWEKQYSAGERDSAFFASAGLGAIHYFKIGKVNLGLRADARYRFTDTDGSKFPGKGVGPFNEGVLSVGLVIPLHFGAAAAPAPEEKPVEVPPAPQPMPKPMVENPARRFEDIHFAFDKSDLTDYAQSSLDSDAATINELAQKFPTLKVDVAGHTDWIGTEAYNQALSERRANAVKEYLIRKGVDAGRIRTFAYGESQPIAPNTTAEGRALNRRAEIRTNASE